MKNGTAHNTKYYIIFPMHWTTANNKAENKKKNEFRTNTEETIDSSQKLAGWNRNGK